MDNASLYRAELEQVVEPWQLPRVLHILERALADQREGIVKAIEAKLVDPDTIHEGHYGDDYDEGGQS